MKLVLKLVNAYRTNSWLTSPTKMKTGRNWFFSKTGFSGQTNISVKISPFFLLEQMKKGKVKGGREILVEF